MRVVFDSQIFLFQRYGGVSRYFYELAKKIATQKSVDLFIVAPFYVNKYIQKYGPIKVYGCRSFFFDGLLLKNKHLKKIFKIYFRCLYCLKLIISHFILIYINPEIIHETYYSRFKIGGKRPIRILTVHDMIHEKFPEFFDFNPSAARSKKIAIDRADHIICVSESTRQDLIKTLDVPESKITVVYHGCNLLSKDERARKLKDKALKLIGNTPYIFYVGPRSGYKNFNRLVESFRTSRLIHGHYKLVCFGGGKFSLEELGYFKKLGVADGSIIQLDGDDERLNDLYSNASIFVYPSIYEGFGIPLLEAMSNLCPVACSNSSSLPEVAGDAALFFDPLDTNSLTKSIEEILTSEVIRKKLIKNGINQISKFNWEKCATETQKVYEKVIFNKGLM